MLEMLVQRQNFQKQIEGVLPYRILFFLTNKYVITFYNDDIYTPWRTWVINTNNISIDSLCPGYLYYVHFFQCWWNSSTSVMVNINMVLLGFVDSIMLFNNCIPSYIILVPKKISVCAYILFVEFERWKIGLRIRKPMWFQNRFLGWQYIRK